MTVAQQGLDRITDAALVMFNEWLEGAPPAFVDEETFCREFVRAIVGDTLDFAADYMRDSGPTIAAILLEEVTREVRMAARAA